MLPGRIDGIMLRVKCLDDHSALLIPTSCPPRHLRQELKSSFTGPEIGESEGGISGNDPYQGHIRKIISFSNHLGPHQYVDLVLAEHLQYPKDMTSSAGAVPIHPGYTSVWKDLLQFLLQLLCTEPVRLHALMATERTFNVWLRMKPTVMAGEKVFLKVVGQRQVTVIASDRLAAGTA